MSSVNDTPEKDCEPSGVTRRQAIVVGATAAGIVSMTLPAMASAASAASPATTTTVAPYSESGSADPSLAAINAIPVVTTNGNVEVSGSDSF